jgi:site-specific recombinase XerD
VLGGEGALGFGLINDYLDYLVDRAYSPHSVEAYAFDLLTFARWPESEHLALDAVTTDSLVRYLAACRKAPVRRRPGGNEYSIRDGRNAGFAPSTINRRLAAISGLFSYRQMLDPSARGPVPRGKEARWAASGELSGELGHLGRPRSRLRLREPRRLPRALDRDELRSLIGSFRTYRDRAMAGLMVFSGLRSAEVLSLRVRDVDIGRGWVQVIGRGDKRRVPPDPDVASLIQTYLSQSDPRRRQRRCSSSPRAPIAASRSPRQDCGPSSATTEGRRARRAPARAPPHLRLCPRRGGPTSPSSRS